MSRKCRLPRHRAFHEDIPAKANRILNLILLSMVLITVRMWHLAIVQYDEKVEESRKPQRRIVVEAAKRATIRDRFNIPLAINKIEYQATVLYSQIQQIPSVGWDRDSLSGKRIKKFRRKEYISRLAQLLGEELNMDAERLEDLIHAKASYYAHIPFIIKESLSEQEYYRLKILEKDWLGIQVRRIPKRFYPRGKVASDIIGYMGAINKQEYESIIHEMRTLERYIEERESGETPDIPFNLENTTQVRNRLKDLQEKAYTIHDYVGKSGIEGKFEQELRGFQGHKSYYSDARGNFLRQLPGGREPLSGQRILLSLSVDLQEYAETLLAQNETFRVVRMSNIGLEKNTIISARHPWTKGGAIVAMDPHTGEIIAMASFPRSDPNDFISSGDLDLSRRKRQRIARWFESDSYLADIWEQKIPIEREKYDVLQQKFYEESRYMTWETYLDFILPPENEARKKMDKIGRLQDVILFQKDVEEIKSFFGNISLYAIFNSLYSQSEHVPFRIQMTRSEKDSLEKILNEHRSEIELIKSRMDVYLDDIHNQYDKVLFIDLCRLLVDANRFCPDLLYEAGGQTLSFYHNASCSITHLKKITREMTKELFHDFTFKEWRRNFEKEFLKKKREEEKIEKKYPKPYIDYLDKEEEDQFQIFWNKHESALFLTFLSGMNGEHVEEELLPYLNYFDDWHRELSKGAHQAVDWREDYLLAQQAICGFSKQNASLYLSSIRGFSDLNRPLLGRYRHLRNRSKIALEKHLAMAFYPVYGYGYARSFAYRQAAVQGSIFKIVTAYEGLVQQFRRLNKICPSAKELNPLEIVDQVGSQSGGTRIVGHFMDGKPIPQLYNGGRLPRSQIRNIGHIDIIKALETSSNPYFSLLASECLDNPMDLVRAARDFSYGCKTGIDLTGELSGNVPEDVLNNKTGLYSLAIGQHSMVVTPLQTAVMLSAIANGGKVLKPKIVNLTAGRAPRRTTDFFNCAERFPYKETLEIVGIDFPLFLAASLDNEHSLVSHFKTEIKRQIFMPVIVRKILLQAMHKMVYRTQNEGLASLKRLYASTPEAIQNYQELKDQLIGKTSTSEAIERIDLDCDNGLNIYTHVWFGGISFSHSSPHPQLFIARDELGYPELVVVVYLRYGGFGKEAAPLAAQMVKKWREIQLKRQS